MPVKQLFRNAVLFGQAFAYGRAPEGGPTDPGTIALRGLDGEGLDPEAWRGRVVLFVNVASQCGLTPQYAGLQALHQRYQDRGFTVVGTPCNQFLGQEPGDADAIRSCQANFGVTFPVLAKQEVNGAQRSDLYRFLVGSEVGGGKDIGWNFEKFLVGRDGQVVARFAPDVAPDAPQVVAAIEAALGVA